MLVVNDAALRPLSEKRVAEWLRSPADGRSLPGVAIADCHVAEPGKSWTQQIDFVVFTPHAVSVLEIKGTHPDLISGCVIAEPNERWRHDLTEIDPVRTRASDRNPLGQVLDAAFRLKSLTSKHNPSHPFVRAVVVLVPPRNSTLTVRAAAMPRGTAVVLGENGLHSALNISRRRMRPRWTAEQVYSMMNALGFGDMITLGELIDEGFPPLDRNDRAWLPPALTLSPAATHRHRTQFPQRLKKMPSAPATPPRNHTGTSGPRHPHLSRADRRARQAIALAIIVSFLLTVFWLVAHFQPNPHDAPGPHRPASAASLNPILHGPVAANGASHPARHLARAVGSAHARIVRDGGRLA